jgi:hypothetical protein
LGVNAAAGSEPVFSRDDPTGAALEKGLEPMAAAKKKPAAKKKK